jgi:hypothetical protein
MNASPSFRIDPAKISRLLGPERGKPHDDTTASAAVKATALAQVEPVIFTIGSPFYI